MLRWLKSVDWFLLVLSLISAVLIWAFVHLIQQKERTVAYCLEKYNTREVHVLVNGTMYCIVPRNGYAEFIKVPE